MTTVPMPMAAAAALQALERGDIEVAIQMLEAEPAGSPESGVPAELKGLLGKDTYEQFALAYFKRENYAAAALHYAKAVELEPKRTDLQEMLELAQANAAAAVNVHVPDEQYFDRASLLAPPTLRWNALPAPLAPLPPPGLVGRFRIALGNVLGVVATAAVEVLTHTWGRLAGYRGPVWTNWYRWPTILGVTTLAYMRELLNAHNLVTTYPPGTLTGFQRKGQTPPPGVTHFRTADGSWNDLEDPKQGAANTRFLRNVALSAARPETGTQLLTPNPREISLTLLTRTGPMQEVEFLNLLAGAWIQFMNHDWVSHGEVHLEDFIEVPLPEGDPARTRYQQTTMHVARTQADPTRMDGDEVAAVSFINEVTHWWDGSQIYGSDQATQDSLRSHVDGKLRLTPEGTLPLDSHGVEETGFKRNWWVGLALLHTLFVREHNAICDHLKAAYPDWNDNRLFNVARLINAAVMAKIHSVEWTPAILPNPGLDKGMNGNWFGLLTNAFRKGKARKTLADIKVRNPEAGGLVGNPIDKHGVGFGFSEEFTEVYRLHSLLPETLALRGREGNGAAEQVTLHSARQSGSAKITGRFPHADLLFSFGTQHPGQLVLNNFPRFMQELSVPGIPFLDMATVDILRARERGVPRYNEFRRQLGLNPIRTFEDLTDNAEHVRKLKQVYGSDPGDVELLDLLVGTLAEGHRPTGFGFGETLFQIFIVNASRRLQADRFYTDYFNADVYTPEGLRWIDATDLKTALLRQYPELASTGLANVKNAFEPWDTGKALNPKRHPLREWDPELKTDPWRGDAYPSDKSRRRLLPTLQDLWSGATTVAGSALLTGSKAAWRLRVLWPVRRAVWDLLGFLKAAGAKPLDIPVPEQTERLIHPVPLNVAVPALPIKTIRVARPEDIPADEQSAKKSRFYRFQLWLYSAFSPMQPGLPPIDADPAQALRRAFTWPRTTKFDPPALPAELLGSPDLGSLAVRGPYACYTEKDASGGYKWDLGTLGQYAHHEGLHELGAKVLFRVNPVRRALEACEIHTSLGSARPGDPKWELSKKIALCTVTTHLSLVRHFNWTHLASAAHLAIATRNRLPADHALCRLLWPYMYGTQQSNDMVTRGQMVRGGDFETVFSYTFDGMCRLFDESYGDFRMVVNDPEEDAQARQIRVREPAPSPGFDTPTQDNLEALFKVMHEHAKHYLRLYYPDTQAIRSDPPILAWLDELNGLIPNGAEVARDNVTFDNLARLIARFIYLVTVQHELLGSFLWNYQLWTHRQPVRVYTNGQREPLDVYQRLVNANYNLNVHRRALMDDFSYLALDAKGKEAFAKFREDLKALQASMEQQPWTAWTLYPAALKVNINA